MAAAATATIDLRDFMLTAIAVERVRIVMRLRAERSEVLALGSYTIKFPGRYPVRR